MALVKLTARNVFTLPAGPHRLDYVDETLPNFRLRVSPSGNRTFAVMYFIDGKVSRYTIGRLPHLSLADARDMARKILADAERGGDPQAARVQARQRRDTALTFADLGGASSRGRRPTSAQQRSPSTLESRPTM